MVVAVHWGVGAAGDGVAGVRRTRVLIIAVHRRMTTLGIAWITGVGCAGVAIGAIFHAMETARARIATVGRASICIGAIKGDLAGLTGARYAGIAGGASVAV